MNLQEVIKKLLLSGLGMPTTRELCLDIRPHDMEAAYVAAGLHTQTREYSRGLGDRSCFALATSSACQP